MSKPDLRRRLSAGARKALWGAGGTLFLLATLASPGCVSRPKTPASQPSETDVIPMPSTTQPSHIYQEVLPGDQIAPDDTLRALVEVIRITAPMGSLSDSPTFWQVTSDRMLSPDRQRVLAANGMRLATIEASAWPSLKAEIDRHAGITSQTSMAGGSGRAEIGVRSVSSQTLFFFDQDGLHGRTFDSCDNFWGLRFGADPAERGKVALDVCPVVRTSRRQTRVTRRNNEYEVDFDQPEALYQIGMQLHLPLGMALVIAPTPSVRSDSSALGRAFLSAEDPAGLMEYVLVLYPRLYRLSAKLTQQQFETALKREQQQLAQPGPTSSGH